MILGEITKNRFFNSMTNSTVSQPTSFIIGQWTPTEESLKFLQSSKQYRLLFYCSTFPNLAPLCTGQLVPFLATQPLATGWLICCPSCLTSSTGHSFCPTPTTLTGRSRLWLLRNSFAYNWIHRQLSGSWCGRSRIYFKLLLWAWTPMYSYMQWT